MDREKWRNGLAAAQALGLGTGRFLLFGMWPGRRGLPSFFFWPSVIQKILEHKI